MLPVVASTRRGQGFATPTEAHWVLRSKFGRFSQPWGREAPTSTLQARRDMSVSALQQSKTVSKPLLLTDKHLHFFLALSNRKQAFPCNSWKTIFEEDLKIFCSPVPSLPQCHRIEAMEVLGSLALKALQWTDVPRTLCLELC